MNTPARNRAQTVAVVGPGSVGLLWSAYLADRVPVYLVGRAGSSCLHFPFTLTRPDGAQQIVDIHRYPPSQLPNAPDVVLFTTKAHDLEQAFADLAPHLPYETPIIFFQNGLGAQLNLSRQHGIRPLLAASTTEGANRLKADHVVHAGYGQTWIGGLTPAGTACASAISTILSHSALTVETEDDIEDRLWRKLAINAAINPFTAILGCRNGELPGNLFFEERLPAVIDEFVTIAGAHQRQFEARELIASVYAVANQTARNRSSMLQDLDAGKATEIAHINGFLVAEGKRLGFSTPVNRELTEQVLSLVPH